MKHNRNGWWIYGLLLITLAACTPGEKKTAAPVTYTCPMHPQIVQEGPGTCPICFMDLVPVAQAGNQQEIVLSERQMALAGIRVAPLSSGNLGSSTVLTGKLAADQELVKVISSRVPGRIEKLYVKETGVRISKGQPLYGIYSEELMTLQKEYLLALKQYNELGNRNERYASFMEAAKKKLLLYGMTEAQVNRLGETEVLSPSVTFVAPASGIVTEIAAAEGSYVTEGSALYRVEGLGILWAEAELYPGEASLVRQGDSVRVIVYGFENQPAAGKVVFMNPEYRPGTGIITLRAQIDNPEGAFAPGMQAGIVLGGSGMKALALPADAVVRGGKGSHVWVKTGERTFMPRIVKTGLETFDKVEITEGLQEGDPVVISGAYLLYSELVLKKGMEPAAVLDNNHSDIH